MLDLSGQAKAATTADGRPPEHPAEDADAGGLFGGEVFVRVFVGVLAANAQAAARGAVEVFDAEHAVVVEGVNLAVFDVGGAAVDAEGKTPLPAAIESALRNLGCGHISPEVTPYIHGAMNQ